MSRKLVKDSTIYGLGQILTRAFGFLLIPIYTRYLDVHEYGSLALLNMLLQLMSFICLLGISQAAMRFYYEPGASESYRGEVYGTATGLLLVLPVLATLVIGPVVWALTRELLPSIPFFPYIFIVLVIGIFTPLDKLMTGLLRIQRRAAVYVVFNVGFFLLQTLTILAAVVWLGYGLVGQLWAQLIANAACAVAAFAILRRFSPPRLDRPLALRMLRFGIPLIPFFILTWLSTAAGRFVLEGYATLTDVGLFALAAQFAGLLLLVSTAADSALMPHFLERAGRPGTEKELGLLITRYVAVIGTVSLGVVAFSPAIIDIVSAPEYHDAATYVAPLVLATWLSASSRPVIWCFTHTSRTGALSIIQACTVIVLLGLLVLCLGPLHLGINGVALAMTGSSLFFWISGWTIAGLGYRPRIPWVRFVPICALLLVTGLALHVVNSRSGVSLLALSGSALLIVIVGASVAWIAGLRHWKTLLRRDD